MSLHAITANWQITINPRPQDAQVEEQLLRWTANPGIAMRECDNGAKFISHTIHNPQQLHVGLALHFFLYMFIYILVM